MYIALHHDKHVARWLRWDDAENSFTALLELHLASFFAACSSGAHFYLHTANTLRIYDKACIIAETPIEKNILSLVCLSSTLIGCDDAGKYWTLDTNYTNSLAHLPLTSIGPALVPYADTLHVLSTAPLIVLASHLAFGSQLLVKDDIADASLLHVAQSHLNRIQQAISTVITSGNLYYKYLCANITCSHT